MADATDHFPRGRLRRRMWQDMEASLGSVLMLFVTAFAVAAVATALAYAQPDALVKDGHVAGPSYLHSFVLTLGGGAGGLVAVAALTFLFLLARYLIKGDGCWDASAFDLVPPEADQPLAFLELRCKTSPVLDLQTLGDVECLVRTPGGSTRTPVYYRPDQRQGRWTAQLPDAVRGVYHVRWYATRHRVEHVELARAKVVIPPLSPE